MFEVQTAARREAEGQHGAALGRTVNVCIGTPFLDINLAAGTAGFMLVASGTHGNDGLGTVLLGTTAKRAVCDNSSARVQARSRGGRPSSTGQHQRRVAHGFASHRYGLTSTRNSVPTVDRRHFYHGAYGPPTPRPAGWATTARSAAVASTTYDRYPRREQSHTPCSRPARCTYLPPEHGIAAGRIRQPEKKALAEANCAKRANVLDA